MKIILQVFLHFYAFGVCYSMEPITISTAETTEGKTERDEEQKEIEAVPMTEQVMDPNIKITDVPDVEEASEDWDANWDKNKIIRDIAYYMRAHKFQDYDRRYYKRLEDSSRRLYEEFPKPPLRSLHWEVRRHCEASFVECLKYLEKIIEHTALKREDDTVTIMKEQKWNLANNAKQILAAQRDCQTALRRDSLTTLPFQGPIERFQWRATVSYYMCWYTMLGVPELSIFGESCDNHANCQFESEDGDEDPRADDTKPYGCALYSFCPDHCCSMKHIRDMTDCYQSPLNPCYAGNSPAHRECALNRQENQDFLSLVANQINISCECRDPGYEWSSRFGLCVDVNECTRGEHGCSMEDGETCMNLPGGYECVCKFGYVYESGRRECVFSTDVEDALTGEKEESNITETKSVIETIVRAITRSSGNHLFTDDTILFTSMSMALRDWYADRELLLTGVTSDVGRAVLEKILRSFPSVKVYLLLRSRYGYNKDDRIKNIFLTPRFERLRQEDPNAISRVKALEGNLLYDNLGTTKLDGELLRNVTVVLHAAGPSDAVFRFCQGLPRLQVVAAISSVFLPQHDGRITESLEKEHAFDGPVALVRIPLVGPALREPMPGFVDVFKESTALMVGAGFALGNSEFQAEIIPIDLAVNTLVAVAWERATAKNVEGAIVYNATSIGCTWNDLIKKGRRGNRKFTYPTFGLRGMTSMAALHWILVLLFEWLPSALCDTILGLLGAKKRLLKEHQRVRNALRSLESISSRPWAVERNRVYLLRQRLTTEDQDAFPVVTEIDIESYVLCAAAAAKKYCVDESNISLVKIFRLLFFFLIAAVLFSTFFFYRYHVPAKYHEL